MFPSIDDCGGLSLAKGEPVDAEPVAIGRCWPGGRDRSASGPAYVRALLPIWLDERRHAVSAKTYKTDAALPRLVPTSLGALQVGAVTDRDVSRALIALARSGLAESSVKRFRDSLSGSCR
jgi:hypothetical protein